MTITSTDIRIKYNGNGVTTAFAFPNKFLDEAHLVVYETDDVTKVATLKTLTTHYTVSGAGESSGGTVTMLVATPSDVTLTIFNDPTRTQGLNLYENDPSPAEAKEEAYDKNVLMVQRLYDLLSRAPTLPDGFIDTFDMDLPIDLATADEVLGVNSAGNGWEMKSAADLVSILGALIAVNNLSDLASVPTALVNLGIAPLTVPVGKAFTDGMSASDITGLAFVGTTYNVIHLEYAANQGAGTKLERGEAWLFYTGSAWVVKHGAYSNTDESVSEFTFTVVASGGSDVNAQPQLATASGSGVGNLQVKYHAYLIA